MDVIYICTYGHIYLFRELITHIPVSLTKKTLQYNHDKNTSTHAEQKYKILLQNSFPLLPQGYLKVNSPNQTEITKIPISFDVIHICLCSNMQNNIYLNIFCFSENVNVILVIR